MPEEFTATWSSQPNIVIHVFHANDKVIFGLLIANVFGMEAASRASGLGTVRRE
jgi:hypothetical protein